MLSNTQRSLYTEKLLDAEAFTHRSFCTKKSLHRGAFTRSGKLKLAAILSGKPFAGAFGNKPSPLAPRKKKQFHDANKLPELNWVANKHGWTNEHWPLFTINPGIFGRPPRAQERTWKARTRTRSQWGRDHHEGEKTRQKTMTIDTFWGGSPQSDAAPNSDT